MCASIVALVLLFVLVPVFGPFLDAQIGFSPSTRLVLSKGLSAGVTGGLGGLIVSGVRLFRSKRQGRVAINEPKRQGSGAVWMWDGSKWVFEQKVPPP